MRERRMFDSELEVRANDKGTKTLSGYAAVLNRLSSNLGGFVEQIAPGAFTKTVTEADVRHLINHDPNYVLGRNRSGTLRLSEDSTGLHYEVDLPNTQAARDLSESVERGDITGSSFAFRVVGDGDEWGLTDDDFPLRTVRQVALYDTSTVTYPAYPSTQADDVKAAVRSLADATGRPLDELVAAAQANELRSLMLPEEDHRDDEGPGETHPTRLAVFRRELESIRFAPGAA